ncbi:MAG: methyltransferase domain-containing protein [Bauldia sp.]
MTGPIRLFDKQLLDQRRRRALQAGTAGADFLYRAAADDIIERLQAVTRRFALAAEIGSPNHYLADCLAAHGVDKVVRLDRLPETLRQSRHPVVAGDAEALPFAPASLNLAVSALHLQWLDDLPGALAQLRRALKPDGLLVASLLGGDTLAELRQAMTIAETEVTGGASPRVAPFLELRDAGALLQRAGFALPVIDTDRRTVRYDSALHLMRDLRAMGAANALLERDRRPLRRAVLMRAAAIYAERFADPDGRVRATFDIVSMSGWAPAEGQQKPLRPGSATARLADALKTNERPAGEKAGR